MTNKLKFEIEGMTCDACVRAVRGRLERTQGVEVEDVSVGSALIRHDPAAISIAQIEDVIADEGYTAFVSE